MSDSPYNSTSGPSYPYAGGAPSEPSVWPVFENAPQVIKLWAYECGRCGNHTLTISRPYRCGSCRKRYPTLVGSVDMTLQPPTHRSYPSTPDPSAFSDPKDPVLR